MMPGSPERRDMRKRFIKWLIKVLMPGYHLSKNGSGRKKKEKPIEADYKEIPNGQKP